VLTFRLRVVHCFPSAIRLEEYIVPEAFWSCPERRSKEAVTDPNAIVNAIATTQRGTGLVSSVTLVMNDFHRAPNILPATLRFSPIKHGFDARGDSHARGMLSAMIRQIAPQFFTTDLPATLAYYRASIIHHGASAAGCHPACVCKENREDTRERNRPRASKGQRVEVMTKIKDLHRRWNKDNDYRADYEALDEEFQLARALIEAWTRAG
jgi:hypothetical protein